MRGTRLFNRLQKFVLCRVTLAHGLIDRLLHSTHAMIRCLTIRVLSANLSLLLVQAGLCIQQQDWRSLLQYRPAYALPDCCKPQVCAVQAAAAMNADLLD